MKQSTTISVDFILLSIAVFYAEALEGPTVKQCTFDNLDDPNDKGQIQTCDFEKAHDSSALRVTYQGDIRLEICSNRHCCRRWFITINGEECKSPAPIDVAIHAGGNSDVNLHRPATIDGICSNIPKGHVTVGLSVGNCKNWGYDEGNAHTCWGPCRLIIEEMHALQ